MPNAIPRPRDHRRSAVFAAAGEIFVLAEALIAIFHRIESEDVA
jgi:hypothetical protein